MNRWQLQDAKARLSDLVRLSRERGPQEITVRGKPAAVVLSRADYDSLRRRKPRFWDFLRRSPLVGVNLAVERERSAARDADL